MIYIKNLGVLTDHDITKVQPFEFGLTLEDFPYEHLNAEAKKKVQEICSMSSGKIHHLCLDFTLNFEIKTITVELFVNSFNTIKDGEFTCTIIPIMLDTNDLINIKKQLFLPFMMSMNLLN